jgi:Cu+-exporting ATPase
VFIAIGAALTALTLRRGARDPVCGMTVDRRAGKPTSVYAGRTFYFCGDGCKAKFDAEPERYLDATGRQGLELEHAGHH